MDLLATLPWTFYLGLGLFLLVYLWFFAQIARKAGFSRWWVPGMLVFPVNIVLIWIFAYVAWPNRAGQKPAAEVFD